MNDKTPPHFCPHGDYILVDWANNKQNIVVHCTVC